MGDTSAEFRRLMAEFNDYVGTTVAVYGDVIAD